ncbi:RelE family toxin-antitoxin system [Klebsiella pneumoniae]|nr:ead/Ea22-like family protein [Klebsiella pneumoniae]STR61495.1 RelE family toxin-antitoxin system [Klebsiella pneumoniae]
MNDITELAQRMKAAAEKATPGEWVYFPKNTSIEYDVGSDESQGSILYVDSGDFTQVQTDRNGEFIALANPANILALVEALESKERTIQVLESSYNEQTEALEKAQQTEKTLKSRNCRLEGIITAAENRIAALENDLAAEEERRGNWFRMAEELGEKLDAAEEHIAKFEIRTVRLPKEHSATEFLFPVAVYPAQELTAALTAQGIKVEAE